VTSSTAEWARVEAALDVLLELPAHEREAALHRLAGEDAGLHAELESLLVRVDGVDAVLDRPVLKAAGDDAALSGSLPSGTRIGAYRVVCLIGRGGMGEVYRAERADGQYQQAVALKLVRREIADQPARFQAERQTLARLDHPGIARLLDGGVAEDGRPYMVMELVNGRSIIDWCAAHACSLEERLRLFRDICSALEYAHRNLIVHRDLKPANVLVTDEGAVKLLDFGIAKLLGAPGDAALTQHAAMTPGYAAPEQLTGGTVTTATDVYALGMLLFELLTGERPWRLQDLSLVDGIEKVLREAPPAPSRLAETLAVPPVAPKLLRGDLDAIVSKAVRKESDRRYETVAAMRSDVERSQRHEPVAARDGAASYLLGRFLRRNRLWVASGGLIAAAVIAGVVGVAWQARVATGQARRAELANEKATAVKDFLLGIFKQSSVMNPSGAAARNVTAEQLLAVGAERIRFELKSQPEIRSELLDTLALLYDELGISDRSAALAEENLQLVRAHDGDSPAAVRAETRLAEALIDGGKDEDAKPHLRAALSTLDTLHDRDSVDRAAVLVSLARVAYDGTAVDKKAGLAELREALEIVRKRDPSNALHGTILDYLGWYAQLDEDYPGAERWFRQLLAFEQSGGTERNAFAIGNAHLSLGDDQQLMKHYPDAEMNLQKAVDLLTAAAGRDHPATAAAKSRLGETLFRAGHRSEAEPLLIDALEVQKKSPQGIDDATETRKTLGALEYVRGRLRDAEQLLRENLAQLQSGQDKELRYGVSASVLTTVLTAEGNLTEARSHYERASDVFRHYIGEQSLAYSLHLVRGAALEAASGRREAAEQILLKLLEPWPAPPPDLPDLYVKATLELSRLRLLQDRNESARTLATGLLEKIQRSPEREQYRDPEAVALRLRGEAVTRMGRAADAEGDLRRAVELRVVLDDAISPWLAEARVSLARCLMAQNRIPEARTLLTLAASAEASQPALDGQYRVPLRDALRALPRS